MHIEPPFTNALDNRQIYQWRNQESGTAEDTNPHTLEFPSLRQWIFLDLEAWFKYLIVLEWKSNN